VGQLTVGNQAEQSTICGQIVNVTGDRLLWAPNCYVVNVADNKLTVNTVFITITIITIFIVIIIIIIIIVPTLISTAPQLKAIYERL
jgi:hypothetical protein